MRKCLVMFGLLLVLLLVAAFTEGVVSIDSAQENTVMNMAAKDVVTLK